MLVLNRNFLTEGSLDSLDNAGIFRITINEIPKRLNIKTIFEIRINT